MNDDLSMTSQWLLLSWTVVLACVSMAGCQVLYPVAIPRAPYFVDSELATANEPAIEQGKPLPLLDTAGQIVGIPSKILLWDRRIDRHRFSEGTIEATTGYLAANRLGHVKVRLNQYAPMDDLKRLHKNRAVAWPYRYTLGLLSVGGEALLPGRLLGGDHFNPFTQTVHLYSDVPSIALHELAHAKDFSRRRYQGTYAMAYGFFPLFHESIASRDVMDHLFRTGDRDSIVEAYRVLYPAWGTYAGNSIGLFAPSLSTPLYYGAVVAGHANGRILAQFIDDDLAEYHSLATRR